MPSARGQDPEYSPEAAKAYWNSAASDTLLLPTVALISNSPCVPRIAPASSLSGCYYHTAFIASQITIA